MSMWEHEDSRPPPPIRVTSMRDKNGPTDRDKKKGGWFGGKKNQVKDRPEISSPVDFEHTVHVGFDPNTGEFTGMPEAWAKLLQNSGISQAEKKKNPQNVIKALEFFTTTRSGTGEGETKFLTAQRMGKLLRCQRNRVLYERKGWRKRGSYT